MNTTACPPRRALPRLVACLPVLATLVLTLAVPAEDRKPEGAKADPASTPLEVRITGEQRTFELEPWMIKDVENAIVAAREYEDPKMESTPTLDHTLEIVNTGKTPVEIWTEGDPFVLTLTLKGKGAVNLVPRRAVRKEFISPKAVRLAPGESFKMPLRSLQSGFRGEAHYAYWKEAGDYEITATLRTGVSPAPEGAEAGEDGFGMVTLTSAPFAVKVELTK
ncbi:MAG: hypothetical protein HUU15_14085 [Candidatus Brocadiae bacterium]|nr:hypothetical protein [Candidatus Brocadiia bacterium]